MRATALLLLLACGAPPELEPEPEPRIIIPGKITPYLHVAGDVDEDGKVNPTGVAFDARAIGWRVSCLNGVTPRLEPGDQGAMRLFCGWPAGAP